jgi:ATP-binding cassette subfamily C protein
VKDHLRSFLRTVRATVPGQFLHSLALMILLSLTEGIGLALLLPTLQAAGMDLGGGGRAGQFAAIVDRWLARIGLRPDLLLLLGIFVALVGARSLAASIQRVAAYRTQREFEDALRIRLYRAIAAAGWLFLVRNRSTEFVHGLTSEIERSGTAFQMMMIALSNAVLVTVYMALAFALSPAISAAVLASGIAIVMMLRPRARKLSDLGKQISAAGNEMYANIIEHMQSLKTAKMYDAQERNAALFERSTRGLTTVAVADTRVISEVGLLFELASIVVLAAVLYVSIRTLRIAPAEILLLIVIFVRVMPRLQTGHSMFQNFRSLLPSFENILAMEARCAAAAEAPRASGSAAPMRHELRFDRVSFSYGAGLPRAVSDLSLAIPAGAITAIVGASGAGKSTVVDLAMGLLAPDAGAIVVDGVALSPANVAAWRLGIGYVSQDSFLFQTTVRENLRWAQPSATDAEIMRALEMAGAAQFVSAMPAGLDTRIGERGGTLSQGERQRIALARAFLRKPSLLILDEATNNLDSENEARILDAIARLRGEITTILVAHRLSTIRCASLIHVIENGTLAESGSWEELRSNHAGRFRRLFQAQDIASPD